MIASLFGAGEVPVSAVAPFLAANHYLGPATRGVAYADELGVMVFANPNARRLPQFAWLELTRWCLVGERNGGSRQWARVKRWLRGRFPEVTTIVSYSDPAAGHTGALYRACNWLWAPTWHRLRPPPTGNGDWGSGQQAVKDRWIFPLAPDANRSALLKVNDDAIERAMPWAGFRDGAGGDYKRWRSAADEA